MSAAESVAIETLTFEAALKELESIVSRLEGILRSADWSPRQQRRYDWAMYSLLPEDLT